MKITVIEIDCAVPGGSGQVETLRFTSENSYTNAGAVYVPALQQDFVFEQNLFNRGAVSGEARIGYGDIVVTNIDGRFDNFRFHGFDGQAVRVYLLSSVTEVLSSANLYFTGALTFAEFSYDTIVFSIKDRQEVLNVPHQTALFLGTNSGPTGYEGLPDDIQGQIKPMVLGYCTNVVPYPVNRSRLIYGMNFDRSGARAPVQGVWEVRDKGGEIFMMGEDATLAALIAASITAGYFRVCLAEGLIRLGSVPQGDVTCTVQDQLLHGSSAPRVVGRLLQQAGLVAGDDFNEGDLQSLHEKNACLVGYYLTDDTTTYDIVSSLLASIGAWIAPNRLGVFRFGRFDLPSVDPRGSVATFGSYNTQDLKRLISGDENKGIPIKKLELKFNKRWKRLTKNEMLVSVSIDDKSFLDQDWSIAVSEDPSVAITHKLSQSVSRETYLVFPRDLRFRNGDFSRGPLTTDWDTVTIPAAASITLTDEQAVLVPSVNGTCTIRQVLGFPGSFNSLTNGEAVYDNLPYTFTFTIAAGQLFVLARRGISAIVPGANYGVGTHTILCPAGIVTAFGGINIAFSNINNFTSGTLDNVSVRVTDPSLTPQQEADRLRLILSADLERFVFQTSFDEALNVTLGDKITLQDNRFGLGQGKNFIVVGKEEDLDSKVVTLDVVGEGS